MVREPSAEIETYFMFHLNQLSKCFQCYLCESYEFAVAIRKKIVE